MILGLFNKCPSFRSRRALKIARTIREDSTCFNCPEGPQAPLPRRKAKQFRGSRHIPKLRGEGEASESFEPASHSI